jgi:hypothetical protein
MANYSQLVFKDLNECGSSRNRPHVKAVIAKR